LANAFSMKHTNMMYEIMPIRGDSLTSYSIKKQSSVVHIKSADELAEHLPEK